MSCLRVNFRGRPTLSPRALAAAIPARVVQESNWHLGEYDNAGGTAFNDCGFLVTSLSSGWHYLVAVGTSSKTNYYIDGAYTCQSNKESLTDIGYLGGEHATTQQWGKTDETRVSTGIARSADWIAAEYNNQSSPSTFYSIGSQH